MKKEKVKSKRMKWRRGNMKKREAKQKRKNYFERRETEKKD